MIRKFRGKRSEPITCLKTNDQIIQNDRDKAQLLAQHYADWCCLCDSVAWQC